MSYRRISIIFGCLITISFIAGIFSSVPSLEKQDFLVTLASNNTQILVAVLFQSLMAITYTMMAALLYPVLKKYSEHAAIGYFSFRIIGAGFLYVGIVTLLSLLFISKSSIAAGQTDSEIYKTVSELARLVRDWLNHGGLILPWSMGGLVLYHSFFKMRIIPLYLSIWGMIGSFLTLTATFLYILNFVEILSLSYFLLNMPMILFELTLAVFLFFKGFDSD